MKHKRKENINEYVIRKNIERKNLAYQYPVLAWLFYTIPIFNILVWLGFFIAYFDDRKEVN
jgi:hypothetical protein